MVNERLNEANNVTEEVLRRLGIQEGYYVLPLENQTNKICSKKTGKIGKGCL
jgi:hypothetical protein